jgi:hypothetical protein
MCGSLRGGISVNVIGRYTEDGYYDIFRDNIIHHPESSLSTLVFAESEPPWSTSPWLK